MQTDKLNPQPLHYQLGEAIKKGIHQQGLSEGDLIPSERALSQSYGVSRLTVRRALADLITEGILRREGRRGTVVNSVPSPESLENGSGRRLIAVLMPDMSDFFAVRFVSGMDDETQEQGYSIVVSGVDEDPGRAARQIDRLIAEQVAGFIMVPVACEDYTQVNLDLIRRISDNGLPTVLLDRYVGGSGLDTIVSDNFDGSYECTQHLVRAGHKRIAYLGYPNCSPVADRVAGFKKCLMDNGICPDDSIILQQHPRRSRQATVNAVKELLKRRPSITAISAANDDLATDIWAALGEMGVRVPEDIALTGYDNAGGIAGPAAMLTTVEQPLHDEGRLAGRMVIERIRGYKGEPRFVTLKSRLVVGHSTSARSQSKPAPDERGDLVLAT